MTRSAVCTGSPPCTTREKVTLQKSQRCLTTRYTRYTRYTLTYRAVLYIWRSIRALICTGSESPTPYTRYNPVLSGNVEGKRVEWDRRISRARSKGRRSA
jgi:hypothetical protein